MLGRKLFNLFKRSIPLLALFLLYPFEFVTNLIDFDPSFNDLDQLPFDLFQILLFRKYLLFLVAVYMSFAIVPACP